MMKSPNHPFWHHLVMIIVTEALNIVMLTAGIFLMLGGLVLLKFATDEVFRIAVGLPMILGGLSVFFSKIHEIVLIVVNVGRTRAICYFCNPSD